MRKNNFISFFAIFLTACTSVKDVSTLPPYKDVVGRTVTLKRPVVLEEVLEDSNGQSLMLYANPDGSMSRFVLSHNRKNSDRTLPRAGWVDNDLYLTSLEKFAYTRRYSLHEYPNQDTIRNQAQVIYPKAAAYHNSGMWIIPAGRSVTIEDAANVIHFEMGQSISVNMSLDHPDTGERIRAGYTWGRQEYLDRAPWEEEKTPEKRFVGYKGRSFRP